MSCSVKSWLGDVDWQVNGVTAGLVPNPVKRLCVRLASTESGP